MKKMMPGQTFTMEYCTFATVEKNPIKMEEGSSSKLLFILM
ncbi:MAG TPA: hypothetical protein VN249_05430 [Prolixibacteraceae bacterium]|nr:hypothetical protein [Prolixibacteraceae bacterium]